MSINSFEARRWRRRVGAPIAVAVALLAGLLIVNVSSAQLSGSTFESADGNLLAARDGSDPPEITGLDWENVGISCTASPKVGCAIDQPTGQTDNSFGQGTKEDTPAPIVVNGSIPNNKSDLTRFYVADGKESGDNFLYLAWERVQEPKGTTNMDFEFNQAHATYDADGELLNDGLSANGITPDRTAGDLLIRYDLSQGGTNPTFWLHRWLTSGTPATDCEASNTMPCWSTKVDLNVTVDGKKISEGSINLSAAVDPIRPYDPPTSDTPRSLSPRTFGEAAINLTETPNLFPNDGRCVTYGSAYLKSRSSDSFTAALKDFIAPMPVSISNCEKITVNKIDGAGDALAGATFQLFEDTNDNGVYDDADATEPDEAIGDPCVTVVTDPADTPEDDSDDVAQCSWDVQPGGYFVVETDAPANYELSEEAVSDLITISFDDENDGYSFEVRNNLSPGDITITKVDDDGTEMNDVTFTLHDVVAPETEGDPPTVGGATSFTCTTAFDDQGTETEDDDTNGTCAIEQITPGQYFLVETTPDGYDADSNLPELIMVNAGDHLTRSYTNDRRFTTIVIVCRESDDTLYPSTVSVDGADDQTTIAATDLPEGLTEATVCGLGAAANEGDPNNGRFEGLHALESSADPYDAAVHIPR